MYRTKSRTTKIEEICRTSRTKTRTKRRTEVVGLKSGKTIGQKNRAKNLTKNLTKSRTSSDKKIGPKVGQKIGQINIQLFRKSARQNFQSFSRDWLQKMLENDHFEVPCSRYFCPCFNWLLSAFFISVFKLKFLIASLTYPKTFFTHIVLAKNLFCLSEPATNFCFPYFSKSKTVRENLIVTDLIQF